MALSHISLLGALIALTHGHVITAPARLPASPTPRGSEEVGKAAGWLGQQQQKRDTLTCDGYGAFKCPIGTCFSGLDGFIGCCSVSSCKPRTTCVDWHPSVTASVDIDTGGFLYCSEPSLPLCNTLFNALYDQYIVWCDSTGTSSSTEYTNTVTTGSKATDPSSPFNFSLLFPTTTESIKSSEATAVATAPIVTVTSTQTPTNVAQLPTADGSPAEAQPEKEHAFTSHGVIVGIVCGVAAGGMILLATVWYYRRNRKGKGKGKGSARAEEEKPTSLTPESSRPTSNDNNDGPYGKSKSLSPIDTNNSPPVSQFPGHPSKINDIGSPTSSTVEIDKLQRYTVTNPDLTSPTQTVATSVVEAPTFEYAREAPTDRPSVSATSLVSPVIGDTNRDSSVSTLWPTPARRSSGSFAPYTPSNYHAEAPDSVARTWKLQPPSLPQPYSAATFASEETHRPRAPYTPSNYQPEAPDSIPPALRLSGLRPREYSAATFESDSTARSPVYRGLGKSGAGAPWDFLSAESAIGGGWKNGSPTSQQH